MRDSDTFDLCSMEKREGEDGRNRVKGSSKSNRNKRKATFAKKMEFIGWGSRPLVAFLVSIGKDPSKPLSQQAVANIINKYVLESNLIHPEKKRQVVCDEKLSYLFRKKTITRNRIHDLLDPHFPDNYESSEDDSENYQKVDTGLPFEKQLVSGTEVMGASFQMEKELETSKMSFAAIVPEKEIGSPKTRFAAIVPENIKLLYLKRTLVEDLLRNCENFGKRLIGSYIRIKSDPNDYLQKNSYQLHPVTGVKTIAENGENVGKEVFLQVPNMMKDISIGMLSDCNFSKGEVEKKAIMLHEDITKHWIPRELIHLQNHIDRANEKGWRNEYPLLIHYLERREVLKKPSEQTRLLLEVPKVIADTIQKEPTLLITDKI
ncbi:Plus-3 [Cynara cardunculus var. scolymus]|uniref:Plus-3 n=1 Tax=Cynara cardunculus var. scolymus TaxID=59895 RepID=A0A103Y174_CYNCS|nr:Plus-3 [Cynara cardunculus var. scolymus]